MACVYGTRFMVHIGSDAETKPSASEDCFLSSRPGKSLLCLFECDECVFCKLIGHPINTESTKIIKLALEDSAASDITNSRSIVRTKNEEALCDRAHIGPIVSSVSAILGTRYSWEMRWILSCSTGIWVLDSSHKTIATCQTK
jgi:hypothetical protein